MLHVSHNTQHDEHVRVCVCVCVSLQLRTRALSGWLSAMRESETIRMNDIIST